MANRPGEVRDAIIEFMLSRGEPVTVTEIQGGVEKLLGRSVPPSSVRSYLAEATPRVFVRTDVGTYRLAPKRFAK